MKKLIILLLISSVSCRNEHIAVKSDVYSIHITYIKGFLEKTIPYHCGELSNVLPVLKKDTVINEKDKIFEIMNQLHTLYILRDNNTNPDCDVRMQCKFNFTNNTTMSLCIGELNCIIKDNQRMNSNDTLVYLIRKYSGYYNYYKREDLNYFIELKQFMLPNEYEDLSTNLNPDFSIPPK